MKDFFISSSFIRSEDSSTLPFLIKLGQYDLEEARAHSLTNDHNHPFNTNDVYQLKGNFGNKTGNTFGGQFEFSIDCRHYPLAEAKETENFKWINNRLKNSIYPVFKKEDIFNRFYVIEIFDYGMQAMSPFYRDFTPHIYINGKKLWQQYVGMIRHYTQRKVYLIIDKENNLTTNGIIINGTETVNIRICFKNNLEKEYNKESLVLNNTTDNLTKNLIFTTTTSSIFINGSFNENNLKGDYIYNIGTYDIHPEYIKSLKFEKIEDTTLDVSQQTKEDYFRQAYNRDYNYKSNDNPNDESGRTDYSRKNAEVKITLTLKEPIETETINLIPKSNVYDSIFYNKDGENSISDVINKISKPFAVYNEDGSFNTYIFDKDDDNDEGGDFTDENNNFEFVPEYNNLRVLYFTDTSDNTLDEYKQKIHGKYPYLRWNFDNLFYIGFDNDNNLNNETFSKLFIYDYGELELKKYNITSVSDDSLTLTVSTDYLNKEYNFKQYTDRTLSKYENVNEYTYSVDSSNKRLVFNNESLPLSFYIRTGIENKLESPEVKNKLEFPKKCYVIARCFIVPYYLTQLDNYTYFYSPEQSVLDNIRKNELNTFEPYLYYLDDIIDAETNIKTDYFIYNINRENYDKSKTDTKTTLSNLNIINQSNRNTEE